MREYAVGRPPLRDPRRGLIQSHPARSAAATAGKGSYHFMTVPYFPGCFF